MQKSLKKLFILTCELAENTSCLIWEHAEEHYSFSVSTSGEHYVFLILLNLSYNIKNKAQNKLLETRSVLSAIIYHPYV